MTSGTELVSCAGTGYERGLSGGCADSGDFRARHYVRTALLSLPGGEGARQRLLGTLWLPGLLGRLTSQSSLGEGPWKGRAPYSSSQAGAGDAGWHQGPALGSRDLGGDRCQERGARVRKLGQLRGESEDGGWGQPFSDLIPRSPAGAQAEPSLMARNTPPSPKVLAPRVLELGSWGGGYLVVAACSPSGL